MASPDLSETMKDDLAGVVRERARQLMEQMAPAIVQAGLRMWEQMDRKRLTELLDRPLTYADLANYMRAIVENLYPISVPTPNLELLVPHAKAHTHSRID